MKVQIPDSVWDKIRAAGGIRDDCREQITAEIGEYRENIASVKVSRTTKRLVKQVQDSAAKLQRLVDLLSENREFFYAAWNTPKRSQGAAFKQAKNALLKLNKEMDNAQARFSRVPKVIGPERDPLGDLIWRVLMIRSRDVRRPLPTAPSESAATGKYKNYITLCVNAADSDVSQEKIERTLKECVAFYQRVRAIDDALTFDFDSD